MNSIFAESATIGIVISLLAYEFGVLLKNKFKFGIFNPLMIAIVLTIVFLVVFNVDYDTYNSSAKYLNYLLTPATVSLAIPLYQKLDLLKKNLWPILGSIFIGALASVCSVLAMSVLFRLTHEEYVTLLPKSITTAVGMVVSSELGGYTAITKAIIIITGVLGNMTAEFICKVARIKNPVSKGLAIGTASHAIGTSKAMQIGKTEGAMSGLSVAVAGVYTVILASVFAMFY